MCARQLLYEVASFDFLRKRKCVEGNNMDDKAFFRSAIDVLQTLVNALSGGRDKWRAIIMLWSFGNDNPFAISQGLRRYIPL